MSEDNQPSGWDKGKAEALKRFGKQQKPSKVTTPDNQDQQEPETLTGPAAGIAEARRRFGSKKETR